MSFNSRRKSVEKGQKEKCGWRAVKKRHTANISTKVKQPQSALSK